MLAVTHQHTRCRATAMAGPHARRYKCISTHMQGKNTSSVFNIWSSHDGIAEGKGGGGGGGGGRGWADTERERERERESPVSVFVWNVWKQKDNCVETQEPTSDLPSHATPNTWRQEKYSHWGAQSCGGHRARVSTCMPLSAWDRSQRHAESLAVCAVCELWWRLIGTALLSLLIIPVTFPSVSWLVALLNVLICCRLSWRWEMGEGGGERRVGLSTGAFSL